MYWEFLFEFYQSLKDYSLNRERLDGSPVGWLKKNKKTNGFPHLRKQDGCSILPTVLLYTDSANSSTVRVYWAVLQLLIELKFTNVVRPLLNGNNAIDELKIGLSLLPRSNFDPSMDSFI